MLSEKQKAYKKAYRLANRERVQREHKQNYRRIRGAVLAFLGARCANPNCRWMNLDGTFGCTDSRILQIDHIKRNGYAERKKMGLKVGGSGASAKFYRHVIAAAPGNYRLLCACCNWLYRHEDF